MAYLVIIERLIIQMFVVTLRKRIQFGCIRGQELYLNISDESTVITMFKQFFWSKSTPEIRIKNIYGYIALGLLYSASHFQRNP